MTATAKHVHRFGSLDGLRGASAVFMIGHHVAENRFFEGASVLVDFFFTLSGFVLAPAFMRCFKDPAYTRKVVRARVFRMLPLQIFVTASFVLMLVVQSGYQHWRGVGGPSSVFRGELDWKALPEQLTLTQSLVGPKHSWIVPSWSISTEFLTNLLLCAVIFFIAPRIVRLLLVVTGVVLELVFVPDVVHVADGISHGMASLARGIGGMAVGMLVRKVFDDHSVRIQAVFRPGVRTSLVELTIAGLIALALGNAAGCAELGNLPALALWFTMVLIFSAEGGLLSRWMGSSYMRTLGEWSFGIYLWHVVIAFVLAKLRTPLHIGWLHNGTLAFFVLVTIVTIVTASQTKRWVEGPMQELGRRTARQKPAA